MSAPPDSPFAGFPDDVLKRRVEFLVRAFERASSDGAREDVRREAWLLREELLQRLGRRGEGGDGGGVREPPRPRPGGGEASAAAPGSDDG